MTDKVDIKIKLQRFMPAINKWVDTSIVIYDEKDLEVLKANLNHSEDWRGFGVENTESTRIQQLEKKLEMAIEFIKEVEDGVELDNFGICQSATKILEELESIKD